MTAIGDGPGGSGRGYIFSAAADLPTGDGTPGGDAVFYVGSLRADANGNAHVDGLDYNAWQNGYQQPGATPATGDFNEDGIVDALDYNAWQNHYGSALAPLPTTLPSSSEAPTAQGAPRAASRLAPSRPALPLHNAGPHVKSAN